MKNFSLLFIAFLLLQLTTLAQGGWFEQTSGTTWWLSSVHFTDNNTGWAVGWNGTILKTTDGGTNWNPQSSGMIDVLSSVFFIDQNYGWAVGTNMMTNLGLLLITTNGGTNWASQTAGYSLNSVYFIDQNYGWTVGLAGTILKTTNGGINWFAQSSGTTEWLSSVHFTDNNTGWVVGGNGTILNTTDGGTNWIPQSSGTEFLDLHGVSFTDANNGSAVGEEGTILRTTNGGVTFVEEQIDEIPTKYNRRQNYPNPFNPTTTITDQIPELSFVTLKVYDVLGSEVATLVNKEKQVGSYDVEFNGSGLPSGIYFYRLQAIEFTQVKKMILLK